MCPGKSRERIDRLGLVKAQHRCGMLLLRQLAHGLIPDMLRRTVRHDYPCFLFECHKLIIERIVLKIGHKLLIARVVCPACLI